MIIWLGETLAYRIKQLLNDMTCRNNYRTGVVYYPVPGLRFGSHDCFTNGALHSKEIGREFRLEEFSVKAKLLLILLKVERLGLTLLFLHALYSA